MGYRLWVKKEKRKFSRREQRGHRVLIRIAEGAIQIHYFFYSTGLTGFIGFFLCQLPDEADRMQFAYGEGKMNTLEEG